MNDAGQRVVRLLPTASTKVRSAARPHLQRLSQQWHQGLFPALELVETALSADPKDEWTLTLHSPPTLASDALCRDWKPTEALAVMRELIARFRDFHAQHFFHGALQPGRIFWDETGELRVGDWASGFLAQLANQGPVTTLTPGFQELWSNPHYVAPEVLNRAVLTPASDVFSLTCCLHRWLSGADPFRANRTLDVYQRIRQGVRPTVSDLAPWLDAPVCHALDAALSPQPNDRPTTDELATQLEAFETLPEVSRERVQQLSGQTLPRGRDPREASGPPDSDAEKARQEAIRLATLRLDSRRERRTPRSTQRTQGMLAALVLLVLLAAGLWLIT